MCLALIAETARPDAQEIIDAAATNRDGIGVAYREPENRLITWKKGLSVEEAQELATSLPLPFILHFRLATHGGMSPLLCHPFPVSRNVGVTLQGQAKELLFHNGVWNEHTKFQRRAALRGPVSDTRIMAYVLWKEAQNVNQESVADFLAQQAGKLALFTADGIRTYGEWTKGQATTPDTTEGCLYSNLHHCWSQTVTARYFKSPRKSWRTAMLREQPWDDLDWEDDWVNVEWDPTPTPIPTTYDCAGCHAPLLRGGEAATIDQQPVCQSCLDRWCTPTRKYFPVNPA